MGVTVDGHEVSNSVVSKAVEATSQLYGGHKDAADKILAEMTPQDRNDAVKIIKTTMKGMQTDADRPKDTLLPAAIEERNSAGEVTGIHLGPTEAHNKVRCIVFEPKDREMQPGTRDRLDALMRRAQDFYSAEMANEGYLGRNGQGKTFQFETAPDGKLQVWHIKGVHDAQWYQGQSKPQGTLFDSGAPDAAVKEINGHLPPGAGADNVLVQIVDVSVPNQNHIDFAGQVGGGIANRGFGYSIIASPVLGIGFNTVSPSHNEQVALFRDQASSNVLDWNGLGQRKVLSRGEYASTYVGANIHELGHAFGLPHDFTIYSGSVESNLMGNGFRRFGARFTRDYQPATTLGKKSADILNTNPLFNQQ